MIQDLGLVDAYHPFRLHGHDFYILAQGIGIYTDLTVRLNRKNPPRRDTATMAGSGYLVIAFENDNPGYARTVFESKFGTSICGAAVRNIQAGGASTRQI